jgi:hypothetical protein
MIAFSWLGLRRISRRSLSKFFLAVSTALPAQQSCFLPHAIWQEDSQEEMQTP